MSKPREKRQHIVTPRPEVLKEIYIYVYIYIYIYI